LVKAATGIDYTPESLQGIGERIYLTERFYNCSNGFGLADDTLPERFFQEPGTAGEGLEVPPIDLTRFQEELQKYYRIRGLTPGGTFGERLFSRVSREGQMAKYTAKLIAERSALPLGIAFAAQDDLLITAGAPQHLLLAGATLARLNSLALLLHLPHSLLPSFCSRVRLSAIPVSYRRIRRPAPFCTTSLSTEG